MRKKALGSVVFLIFCMAGLAVQAQDGDEPDLPYVLPDSSIRPLRDLHDARFQVALEERLNQVPLWKKLIRRKKLAVGLVDLSVPERARFARVNGNKMMYAASLPKLAILLTVNQAIAEGAVEEEDVLSDMKLMISKSDNAASTRLYEIVGFEKIESVLTDARYELYDIEKGGGLWVGKPYARRGKRHGDPLEGLSHGATATQVCRFYYLLAMGRLVDRARSESMLDILIDPALHHKFVRTLDALVPDARLYRKSGTWRNWHSDSVLVWGPVWRRYILVALVEDAKGNQILQNLIPAVEEVLQSKQL